MTTILADPWANLIILRTGTAVSPQGETEEPAAETEQNQGREQHQQGHRPVDRVADQIGGNTNDEQDGHDESERDANPLRQHTRALVVNRARITHQRREQPPHFVQALIADQPDRR